MPENAAEACGVFLSSMADSSRQEGLSMDSVFHRRSIRKYKAMPVEREKIIRILQAAMAAPSACNQQAWRFYVVTEPEKIKALAGVSHFSAFAEAAPVLIVPVFRNDSQLPEFAPIDLSAAVENMLIETDALGLGGVWLGVYPRQERAEKIREILELPKNETPFAMVAIGYPAEVKGPSGRWHEEWVTFVE